ncbi:MAG TPA: SurA N-terminal domain-containing protein, partial [Candidatus Binatia bacterium]|nr:SurA N-terminal domain-containing protein [Candidatus Binatia bacterium]
MLDFLRKKKRSWIITILLGLIIVVFIAFYGGSQQPTGVASHVAEVNGESISQREFIVHYQRAVERYREMFKGSFTPELLKNLNIKQSLLEEMIEARLVLQEARRLGLSATDEELMNAIAQVPEFHVNGRFNKERYIQLLRANRLTPAQFEEDQRKQLTIQRLLGVLADAAHVTEAEVRERYRFEQEKINLQFVRFSVSDNLSDVRITDEDVQKFYDRNKESLKEPLKVQVEYIPYSFEQFSGPVQLTDKEVEDYYNSNRATKFTTPKQAKVRYVMVRLDAGADAKQKEAAQVRANRIVAEARGGKSFAELAKKESQDPSAEKGGEIGWLNQGQLPEALDKQIFALAIGEISEPIETPVGFHIVKVEDIKEEKTLSLAEAKPVIMRELKLEKGKYEAAKIADRDREKAASGNDLAKLAQENGLSLKTTRLFSEGEVLPEIGPTQDFYKTALALKAKEVSSVIEGPNAYYVLQAKERTEAVVPPLDAVRGKIEKGLKESKAYEMSVQQANDSLDQVKKEPNLAKLARDKKLKLEETGWFVRNTQQLPKVGELQNLTAGSLALSARKPIPDRIFTQADAAFVFAFKEAQPADMAQFEKDKSQLMQQALTEARQLILLKFKDELKAKAKIEINSGP